MTARRAIENGMEKFESFGAECMFHLCRIHKRRKGSIFISVLLCVDSGVNTRSRRSGPTILLGCA
jgi:hypothetical protein